MLLQPSHIDVQRNGPWSKVQGASESKSPSEYVNYFCFSDSDLPSGAAAGLLAGTSLHMPISARLAATKKRFARYDAEKDRKVGGTSGSLATGATVIVGLLGIAVLGYLGLRL